MSRVSLPLLLSVLLTMVLPGLLQADGDSRAATPAEREYAAKALGILDKALPAIPQGWTTAERTEILPLERVSTGIGKTPFGLEFHLEAVDQPALDAAQQKLGTAIEELANTHADEQKKVTDEVTKKLEGLTKQMEEAIAKGDTAALERLSKEVQEAQAPAVAMGDAITSELKVKSEAARARDARLRIDILVNAYETGLADLSPESPVAGNPTFWYAHPTDSERGYEGEWTAFAGAWKTFDQDGQKVMTPTFDLALPHTTVQNLLVKVQGDKARARSVLEAIDWGAIADLCAKR